MIRGGTDARFWAGLTLVFLFCAAGVQGQQANPDGSASTGAQALGGATMLQPAAGSVPRLIKFSGVVKDATGKVMTGQLGLTLALYELQQGGSPLWVETQSVRADEQGRYTALLGAESADGLPLDLFTGGKALWLGVQPQLPGMGEQPRVLLVAVPYALKAADADTLGGRPASAYALAGSQALIPTNVAVPSVASGASAAPGTAAKQTNQATSGQATSGPQPLIACTGITSGGTATANTV